MSKALYIHIPFCHNICHYCDFIKVFYNADLASSYIEKLKDELKDNNELYSSIYIGGGSPSSLSYEQLESLLSFVYKYKDKDCEFSIEVNPEDMDLGKIKLLKRYGVNRVSIGVQTFNDKLLKSLNRKHTKKDIVDLISSLRNAGINNISIDIMYGLPEQKLINLKKDLRMVKKLGINHVSCYSLLIEDHTYFKYKNVEALDDDIQADMYEYINKYLSKIGFIRYEVSNYAHPGFESKHNLVYWTNKEYKGIGISASGYEQNMRYTNTFSLTNYLNGKTRECEEKIDRKEREYEFIIMHLRLRDGFLLSEFASQFKKNFLISYKNEVENLLKEDLIEITDRVKVKKSKMFILNRVLSYFVK